MIYIASYSYRMKFLNYFIALTLLSVVNTHPINMICVPACNSNITANGGFVNEWLNHSTTTGLHQLRRHKGTVVNVLLEDASTDIDDCEETYNSLVSVPKHTNVSVDAIRGFFNAYLSHKYFIDHLVTLGADQLLIRDWVYHSNANNVHSKLVELQRVLNFNVKKLAQLLNTTCDACAYDCSQSTTRKDTLISTMEGCFSPIHYVVDTIASHSSKLFKTVKNLQGVASASKNGDLITSAATNIEVNDLCLCNAPV